MPGHALSGGDRAAVAAVSVAVVLVAVTVAGAFAMPASAAVADGHYQTNATNGTSATDDSQSSDWTAPGPFGIDELRTGGDQISSGGSQGPPESTRMLPTGGIVLKYLPLNPAQSSYQPLGRNQALKTDYLLAYTSAFGESVGDYEFVVVFWQEQTTRVNGTQRAYAANQSVQRISFEAENGYSASKLKLQSHYDQQWQATAWLEQDGSRVEGARWRFGHQTNPLTASPAYPTNSKGDLWRWGALNLIIPAICGIMFSGASAKHILSRTIVGTLKGVTYWAGVVAVVVGIAAIVGTWQTSIILANAPIAVGILIGLLALPVMLSIRDSDLSKAGFFRRQLRQGAISPSGEETVGTRRVANKIKSVYRHGDQLYAPIAGLRPMLARYWADPAKIPTEDWKSYDSGDGDLDQLFEVDPESDKVLRHKPARLKFSPSLTKAVADEDLADPPEADGIAALPAAISAAVSNWFARRNWRFIGIALGGGAAVYLGTVAALGSSIIGLGLATLPALIDGHEARDGSLEVDWGPSHWNDVQAQVQTERHEYEERKTFDQVLEAVTELEWSDHEQGQQIVDRVRTEIQKALDDEHGGNNPSTNLSPSSPQQGVDADD
ncbi:hypothetical protein [Haloarcula sp. JP-Z28]|uniref:hypothetical protein n=1 Tax=Haloarcula sp. JP-Z28 TaxID=2716715 RepID=UPI00351A6764